MTKEEKIKARNKLMEASNKKYDKGDGIGFVFNAAENLDKLTPKFMPTGVMELDEKLGGGFGRGSVACIHGAWFCGKTGIALETIKGCVEREEFVLYICTEGQYPKALSDIIGIDLSTGFVDIITPQGYGEEVINTINNYLVEDNGKLRGIYDLVVFDSLNCLVPKATLDAFNKDGAEKDGQMARKAKIYTDMLEQILGRGLLRNGAVFLAISQDRANMDAMSAKYFPTKLTGPLALGYDTKQIIAVSKKTIGIKDPKTNRTEPVGHDVIFNIEKNHMTGILKRGQYSVLYGQGVDDSLSLIKKITEWEMIIPTAKVKAVYGLKGLAVPLENGDWIFPGIGDLRERAKVDNEFKALLRKVVSGPKPKDIELKGYQYKYPSLSAVEVEDEDEPEENKENE